MCNWVFFEPVNFDETVYDSDKLPAIRGASFALLKASSAFAGNLKNIKDQVEFSSSILCLVDMTKEEIEVAIFCFLNSPNTDNEELDKTLKSLSFSFGIAECSGKDENFKKEYITVRNTCQRNRFMLQSARSLQSDGEADQARKGLGNTPNRKKYYEALGVTVADSITFPEDFEAILKICPQMVPAKFGNKMVVLEFDADELGIGVPLDSFETFKTACDRQNKLMKELIVALFEKSISDNTLALETLLYAGDEGVLVFPAWHLQKIMAVLQEHLNKAGNLTSYSIGMVICGVKTPILTVRRLTHELLADSKKITKGTADKKSLVQYFVAGDLGIPVGSVEIYRERVFNLQPSDQKVVFPIALDSFDAILDFLRKLKTRGENGEPAPASHSKIKTAIEVLRDPPADADELTLSYKAALKTLKKVAGTEGSLTCLVQGGDEYRKQALLHAAALMPFLGDAEPSSPADEGGIDG